VSAPFGDGERGENRGKTHGKERLWPVRMPRRIDPWEPIGVDRHDVSAFRQGSEEGRRRVPSRSGRRTNMNQPSLLLLGRVEEVHEQWGANRSSAIRRITRNVQGRSYVVRS
jgi:hypothetical protein